MVTSAAGPRSPSRLQPPRQEAGPSQEADLSEGQDGTTRYQASLERSGTAAWGFAWNVAALAMKRLILAGVDPASPAGAWNTKRKEDGCQPMQRGDEVVAVNEITTYSEMRKELALPALQVNLRLVVDAASAETSPNREALRRRREAGCSKASSASGLGSNESSPMSPKSPAREDSKPRSPLPLGSDHVKVKNTFIEFSDETPREEEQSPVRFTQSDPTPVLEAMRNTTTTTTCTLDSSQRMEPPPVTPSSQRSQEPLEASQTSASPGRRKPTPLSDDSEVSENPGALPSSSPKTEEVDLNTSWIPETPEAFGFGGHPLLLEHLLPEENPMDQEVSSQPIQSMGVEMPIPMPSSPPLAFQPALQVGPALHPVLTAAPAPVLQYAPPMGQRPTSAPQEASERLSPEIRHPRWTSQTLPLPPGALPPGPVASPSEASPSDASAHHEVSPGDSEESETEVTSPESKRKPTRRGGRRARHRKMAALARQQAAAEAAEEVEMDLPHADPHAAPRAYSPAEVKPRSTSSPSGGSTAIPAPSGVRLSSEDGAQLIGRMVLIQGLVRSPEFNGQWGHVESYDPQMQRFMVSVVLPTQLPGETPLYAKLRRDNLIVPRQEMQPPLGSPVPMPAREVHWPAEPAFIQEHIVLSPLSAIVQATPPGPAADFEDSVGAALMTPGCRIQPGASLEDSGSPPQRSSQDSYASKPSMSLGTSPDMLSPEVRQMWLNQGTAADFEDSMVGQLFDSPKAASRGGSSPSSKLKRFGGGFSYAEGTPADFEDSIGGTAGWPDFVKEESSSANTGPSWQPSLRHMA